jgi:Mn2+/Fe2+ NRAMP family transporter
MPAGNLENSVTQIPDKTVAPRGWVVRSPWARSLLTFLMVFGPGPIVMEADNDAGAVSTYVQAGAQYGTHLLWILIVLLPMTYFVQEMVVRLGIATGQGHAAMIYQRFGKWWGRFSLIDLLLINLQWRWLLSSQLEVIGGGSASWSCSVCSISRGSPLLFSCIHRRPR